MAVSGITNTYASTASSSSSRTTNTELGKDDFLNLLVTQLKYQNPLDPTDSTEYISQLAQFSTLEQMNNMTTGISSMEALTMTGKYVTATTTDSSTGETSSIEGTVDSVKLKNGVATLLVNGNEVDLEDVTGVYDYDRSSVDNLSALIGKNCKGYIYDSDDLNIIGVEGTVSGIEKGSYEDYAVMDGVECTLDSITSEDYKSSQDELEYLNSHIGEEISVDVTDTSTNKIVPVTATLESAAEGDDGSITVKLNSVKVPVDGIYSVK